MSSPAMLVTGWLSTFKLNHIHLLASVGRPLRGMSSLVSDDTLTNPRPGIGPLNLLDAFTITGRQYVS